MTVNTYVCQVHGPFDAESTADEVTCPRLTPDGPCGTRSLWAPAPAAVHIPGDALKAKVREDNRW